MLWAVWVVLGWAASKVLKARTVPCRSIGNDRCLSDVTSRISRAVTASRCRFVLWATHTRDAITCHSADWSWLVPAQNELKRVVPVVAASWSELIRWALCLHTDQMRRPSAPWCCDLTSLYLEILVVSEILLILKAGSKNGKAFTVSFLLRSGTAGHKSIELSKMPTKAKCLAK